MSRHVSKAGGGPLRLFAVLVALGAIVAAGCSRDAPAPNAPGAGSTDLSGRVATAGPIVEQRGDTPPSYVTEVPAHGVHLHFWPYTGNGFDGTPVDPMNLIFVGNADPRTIRAALMNLDGNRTAFGFPDAPPFNQRWGDAFGDVQTSWAEGEGWTGSIIQLALGDYSSARVHLRLFRTTGTAEMAWTLGAAHFEVLIPGTADHWVLSWELAQSVVLADLLRAGLVVPPLQESAPITQTPSYRTIPPVIYNGLPVELRGAIGGPLGDQTADVPVANDGKAAILTLGGGPETGVGETQSFTLTFGQAIPKPICSDGPYDYVYVEGPVQFTRTSTVDAAGGYAYTAHAAGQLTVTPLDVTTNPPTPMGPSYMALISEDQQGLSGMLEETVFARSRRIAAQHGGAERTTTDLKLGWNGPKRYRVSGRCLEPEP
ncbi:MAG TPA: hypothetical protein VI198_00010 [Candidatus Eisenbacteria bacterium]